MKRRNFFRYVALGSFGLTGVLAGNHSLASSYSSKTRSHHRWVVLYWMPYDNNLVHFGEPIVEMLTHGTQNSDTAVVIQSDYWGDEKMRRRHLVNGTNNETPIEVEDSSDVNAFSAYLNWANQTFEAEHWAVIIVGHGGTLNKVSPDEHGKTGQAKTWMRVDQFAEAVNRFNNATKERVELLFLQNCNKATLEVVYEVRDCANYTLASQRDLGAPNYYYKGLLKQLNNPETGGKEAAIAIMDSESADMYHTLTLVDNQVVERIPEELSKALKPIISSNLQSVKLSELPTYRYFGEQHCDVVALLDYLSQLSNQGKEESINFVDFLRSSVIASYKTGGELYGYPPSNKSVLENLCGLSLYIPRTAQDASFYSSLALYQEVDLVSLYKKMLDSTV